MKIHIIGGGIIGLSSAYYLNQAGYEVEIIDKEEMLEGCSYGNAGMIVPSHFVPLAAPGVITKGIRWMFNAKSPFYIKPRLSLELAQWLWAFYRSCDAKKVAKAMPVLRDLSLLSKSLYQELSKELDFGFEEKGLLMLYKSIKAQKEEIEMAEQAHELGIEAKVLSSTEVQALEKNIKLNVLGGVFFPGDAHLYPNSLMQTLKEYLKKAGVQFRKQTQITRIETEKNKVAALHTLAGDKIPVDQLIVAAGSWSAQLLRTAGIHLLLQDGKGYSLTYAKPAQSPMIPSILTEAKVAMTPMDNYLRIGGTLEISNLNPTNNYKRIEGILESVPNYYKGLQPEMEQKPIWHGFRPCSPDGLPYIGKSKQFDNLIVASGHAMMGLSLGPGTGKLVEELISQKKPSVELSLCQPERF